MIHLKRLERNSDFWFLIGLFTLFFLLRLPSLFEPYWYGDEAIYQAIGDALSRGAILYQDIWDNKPPLLYYLYSVFGSDQASLRFISAISGIFSALVFFLLAKRLFVKPAIYRSTTAIFSFLLAIPIIEGNIANAENFIIFFSLLGTYIIISKVTQDKLKPSVLFLGGLIFGISFLFKIVAIFDFAAIVLFLFIYEFPPKTTIKTFKKYLMEKVYFFLPLFAGFALPFLIYLIYFALKGNLGLFLNSMFLSNISYVGWKNEFIIPQGFLILKLLLLSAALFIIFLKRESFKSKTLLFVFIWFCFGMFSAFFSSRPYPHYLLILLPSFCLLISLLFYKKFFAPVAAILIVSFVILMNSFSAYGKNIAYYLNFIKFVTGGKDTHAYFSFFDRDTPRDYKIANFIRSNAGENDGIFVWGNNPQIYKLSGKTPVGKYTVTYHIVGYPDGISNTGEALERNKPRFIIIIPGKDSYPFPLTDYSHRMTIGDTDIYERVL